MRPSRAADIRPGWAPGRRTHPLSSHAITPRAGPAGDSWAQPACSLHPNKPQAGVLRVTFALLRSLSTTAPAAGLDRGGRGGVSCAGCWHRRVPALECLGLVVLLPFPPASLCFHSYPRILHGLLRHRVILTPGGQFAYNTSNAWHLCCSWNLCVKVAAQNIPGLTITTIQEGPLWPTGASFSPGYPGTCHQLRRLPGAPRHCLKPVRPLSTSMPHAAPVAVWPERAGATE